MSRAGAAMDFLPFSRLTQSSIAPRVRSLLEGTYQTIWPQLEAGIDKALTELDQELFKHAERAPNVNEQNRSFEGLREFRRHRGEFQALFRDAIQRNLLALVDSSVQDESLQPVKRKVELSLVDVSELEEELVLSEIAAKAEIRASAGLQYLAYRFGVIAGRAPVELESLPLGPHKICASLRSAARKFEVPASQKVMLFRQVDRTLFADPVRTYESINRHLIEHRVFARLNLAMKRASAVAASDAKSVQKTEAPKPELPKSDPVADTQQPGQDLANQAQRYAQPPPMESPGSDAAPQARSAALMPGAPRPSSPPAAAPNLALPPMDGPAAQAYMQSLQHSSREAFREPAPVGDSQLDAQFFATLRELLGGRRHSHGSPETHAGPEAHGSARPIADTRDVQAILSVLQAQPVSPVMVGGKWSNRSIGHIKQDLMNQLRTINDGAPPVLSGEDSDTVDLVGFLFDHLLADYRPNSMSHSLMSRLQVPLLKVALKDKSFFTRRNHPARQLLNSIAETSAYWVEDEEQDRPVIEKMQMVVDRVIKEFDDDVGVFERLFDDLGKHMGSLQKKAEVAERRHVEAARGREKLELARAAAQEAVQQRMFEREPPDAVRALLETAWTDSIALSLLRQGVDSPKTRERLQIVDQLVSVFADKRTADAQRHALEDLRAPLEEGLAAVGFHEEAIAKTWTDISRLVQAPAEHGEQATHSIVELIKQKPRLGEEARSGVTVIPSDEEKAQIDSPPATGAVASILQTLRKPDRQPVGPKEQAMIERIKQMPFGTWFEFEVNQQGERVRRKLCWFSPVTGRCLFLNARGVKAEERMIDQLARDMLRGSARVAEEVKENLIDRAWKGIMGMLKGVVKSKEAAADAPAIVQ